MATAFSAIASEKRDSLWGSPVADPSHVSRAVRYLTIAGNVKKTRLADYRAEETVATQNINDPACYIWWR